MGGCGNSPEQMPLLGINRFVVAADTDREAMELGRRAWPSFYASFMKLWKKHGTQPRYARIPEDFDAMVQNGGAIAGSPARSASKCETWRTRRARIISSASSPSATQAPGGAAFRRYLRPRGAAGRAGTHGSSGVGGEA